MFNRVIPAFAFCLLASGATAQDTQRYQLEKTDRGYVRLDLETGAMSICEDRQSQLVCRSAVEESAGEGSGRAADRLRQLERRVEALEQASAGKTLNSSEEEFEEGLDRMEGFFRRFMGIAREFEREKPEPMPDRT
ncbi:MAG TPA: hypothetical protein VGN98_06955 [Tianweitania sediminis]|jgi:hypothetical protein|nr:hypothetical protein [Tianweitania sediminis]